MPATTTVSQFLRSVSAVAWMSSKNSSVMLLGRWSHPKKSLPAQVPFSKAS